MSRSHSTPDHSDGTGPIVTLVQIRPIPRRLAQRDAGSAPVQRLSAGRVEIGLTRGSHDCLLVAICGHAREAEFPSRSSEVPDMTSSEYFRHWELN